MPKYSARQLHCASADVAAGKEAPTAKGTTLLVQISRNKYVISVKQITKFVKEGMRVRVDRTKYSIQTPLPPEIDHTLSLMTVKDEPGITYEDIGGAKEQWKISRKC